MHLHTHKDVLLPVSLELVKKAITCCAIALPFSEQKEVLTLYHSRKSDVLVVSYSCTPAHPDVNAMASTSSLCVIILKC